MLPPLLTSTLMWQSPDLGNLGSIQNFSCLKITTEGEYGTVTDSRDNKTYRVAKLKDGKCWMVENLKLGGNSAITLTSADSDVTSNFTLPASSTSGFRDSNYDGDWVYVDSTYGGYYSWHAATAGTGTQSMSSGDAASSICPKGWRLPTMDEFVTMAGEYGSSNNVSSWLSALRATPVPGFVLSGNYVNSSANRQGSSGYYWSSTTYSTYYAYYFLLYSHSAGSAGDSRYLGQSVRCVAR